LNKQEKMSAFQELASPAPTVGAAEAERAQSSEPLRVEPALPSEDTTVGAAQKVGPAVTYDKTKSFAPPITKEEASHLSVAALRGSGADFESKVSHNSTVCRLGVR
jgi:hypothetical protein